MRVQLKKLIVKDFKGVVSNEFEFDKETEYRADNGLGKTTLADAFSFLVTGKDASGRTGLWFKPYDKKMNVIHNLDSIVTGIFDVDGKEKSFTRINKEDWKKRRGTQTLELTGHVQEGWIGDINKKIKEFNEAIGKVFQDDLFFVLSNPMYINTCPDAKYMEKRRALLLTMVDTCRDIDIANELNKDSSDYDFLIKVIEDGFSIDEKKASLKKKISDLEKTKKEIPGAIKENQDNLPEAIKAEELEHQIKKLNDSITEREKAVKSGVSGIDDLRKLYQNKNKEVNDVDVEIRMYKDSSYEKWEKETTGLRLNKSKLELTLIEKESIKEKIEKTLNSVELDIKTADKELSSLRTVWHAIKNETFKFDENDKSCPTCNREYDDLSNLIETKEKEFNASKAKRLDSNTEKGKRISEDKKGYVNAFDYSKKQLALIEAEIIPIKKEIKDIEVTPYNIETDEKYISLCHRKKSLTAELFKIKKQGEDKAKAGEVDEVIEGFKSELKDVEAKQLEQKERNRKVIRVAELQQKLIDFEDEINNHLKELGLIEEFEKSKMQESERYLNSLFKVVKWKLWDVHLNGNNKPICDCYVDGVPFNSLNHAMKINAGLDIIRTLNSFHNLYLPVFIDNRESVTEIEPMDTQVINLVVDKTYKELTRTV